MQSQSREPGGTSPPRIPRSTPLAPTGKITRKLRSHVSNVGYWTAEELKTSNLVWQAWHDLPCRTKCLLVLIFAIFPAIRKNKFSQRNDTGNIFPTKIYSRVNILLLNFAIQKRSTKKSCLFIHNLSLSFRNETVYYELLVLCRVRTP